MVGNSEHRGIATSSEEGSHVAAKSVERFRSTEHCISVQCYSVMRWKWIVSAKCLEPQTEQRIFKELFCQKLVDDRTVDVKLSPWKVLFASTGVDIDMILVDRDLVYPTARGGPLAAALA